jgi:hypothetical protein
LLRQAGGRDFHTFYYRRLSINSVRPKEHCNQAFLVAVINQSASAHAQSAQLEIPVGQRFSFESARASQQTS